MKIKSLFILLFVCCSTIAQNEWRSGYYLDREGSKHQGQIFVPQWHANPSRFSFRANEAADELVITIDDAKEFEISGLYKFVRETFEMERSSYDAATMQIGKQPRFNTETQFLRVLVEGPKSLYYYSNEGIRKFFYKLDGQSITQLIDISFLTSDTGTILHNSQFKNQLWNNVKCEDFTLADVQDLRYSIKSLSKYFHAANTCGNSNNIKFEQAPKKGIYNLKLQAGVSLSHMKIAGNPRIDFDFTGIMPGIGAELEYRGFSTSKWSIFSELNYNSLSGDSDIANGRHVEITYDFIEISLGVRHYLFLNDTNKVFFSGLLAANLLVKPAFDYSEGRDYEAQFDTYNFGLGAGYEYKRISGEFRYFTKVPLVSYPRLHKNGLYRCSLVFKYRIL